MEGAEEGREQGDAAAGEAEATLPAGSASDARPEQGAGEKGSADAPCAGGGMGTSAGSAGPRPSAGGAEEGRGASKREASSLEGGREGLGSAGALRWDAEAALREDSRSGGEQDGSGSGEDDEGPSTGGGKGKKRAKRYHRHTMQQIQEMEQLFRECPHPDEKQRLELSRRLGLEPRQVKFWFQNRRTQMKAQSERSENSHLRVENERLQVELARLREVIAGTACPKCGASLVPGRNPPEIAREIVRLKEDNTRLREEVETVTQLARRQQQQLGMVARGVPPDQVAAAAASLPFGAAGAGPSNGHADGLPASLRVMSSSHLSMESGGTGAMRQAMGYANGGPGLSGLEGLGTEAGDALGNGQAEGMAFGADGEVSGGVGALISGRIPVLQPQDPAASMMGGLLGMGAPGGGLSDSEKELVLDLALSSVEELVSMVRMGEPLWRTSDTTNPALPDGGFPGPSSAPGSVSTTAMTGYRDALNLDDYRRRFANKIGDGPSTNSLEASRASGVALVATPVLLELLIDPPRWASTFPCLLTRAVCVDLIARGTPDIDGSVSPNGALQLMYAEMQMLTPLVPTREAFFLRYCKRLNDSTWAVVDVSVDGLRSDPPPVMLKCRRRASGYLIQEMAGGMSRITVVEHMEVDTAGVHPLFRRNVASCLGFGAARWLSELQRVSSRITAMLAGASNLDAGIVSPHGRRSMLRLSERMVSSFSLGVSASAQHNWTTLGLPGLEDVRVMTRRSLGGNGGGGPGEPAGIILSAATSMRFPVQPHVLFDFLQDESSRREWDILVSWGHVTRMCRIRTSDDAATGVSLLKAAASSASSSNLLILQETARALSGSFVIYAPVDIGAMQTVITGGDPDRVALLPSGFFVLPDCPLAALDPAAMFGGSAQAGLRRGSGAEWGSGEVDSASANGLPPGSVPASAGGTPASSATSTCASSVLTIAFQILVSSLPEAKLSPESVDTVHALITCTIQRVQTAMQERILRHNHAMAASAVAVSGQNDV